MMSTREPLMTFDDPLLTTESVEDDTVPVSEDESTHDAIIPSEDAEDSSKTAVNVRLDRDTCRLLRIAAAIDGCSQSNIIDGALTAYFGVGAGTTLVIATMEAGVSDLKVEGTLDVQKNAKLAVGKDLTVIGIVTVAENGKLEVTGDMFVGITKAALTTGAAATVEGKDVSVTGLNDGKVVGNATIKAIFIKTVNTYTVTVVSKDAEKGTVSPNEIVVPYGSDIRTSGSTLTVGSESVTATPADKTDEFTYSFVGWSENATGTVIGDMTIVANFKAETNKYPVTVTVNDSTMGSAAFYLDGTKIDSGTEVEYGKTVTLSISQEKGYMLKSVNHNGNNLYTYKEGEEIKLVYYIDVKVKNELVVEFTKTSDMQFTVTLKCIGNGSIIPGADGKCVLKGESSQDFQISADFGYKIKSVKLDGIDQDFGKVSAVVPIKNIDAVHEIVAEFEKADTYSVQLIGASNGKVDITGLDAEGKAVEGRTIAITATPNFGFYPSKFLVNGKDIDLTLGADSESRTISVDKSLDGDKIVVEVKFALSATADDDDDPVPSPNPSGPETGGKGGNGGSAKVVAAAAACVVVVVAALCIAFWRKN